MNKNFKHAMTIFLLSILATSCGQKLVTNNNTTTGSSSSTSSTGSGSTGSTTPTTPAGCDGVYRANVTQCYYKNLPEVALSGPGTQGITYWSSASDLSGTGISQNQFTTDATFSVRMIPSFITDARNSKQGRKCSQYTATNFTKLKLFVMLRKSGVSVGETAELIATSSNGTWSYSNTYRYSVPSGTTSPFILDVVGVQSDHRCTGKYGTPPANCTYMDIPVVTNTSYPTECVGFKLQMATDETYDLPN